MIPVPSNVRVWLAVGRTDMRRGMNGLALQVQEALRRDPHAGDLFVFRGSRGDLIKIIWHDGLGMSLYAKRLEKGRFIWPSPVDGVLGISASQLAYMLDGIDWRNPRHTFRPERAQGNRVKNSSCDETCEEVVVPSGDFALESEAIFVGGFSDQIEGHVSQRGEIGGGVVGADTAFVVAEDHVHHPV